MNIFFVEWNPTDAAKALVDSHVCKMPTESAQLLSTAHRVCDGNKVIVRTESGRRAQRWVLNDSRETVLYLATHFNHPCAVWCRQTTENYRWLFEHFVGLTEEYKYRYGKTHKTTKLIDMLRTPPINIADGKLQDPALAFNDKYKNAKSPVDCYRAFYNNDKRHLFKWKNRNKPQWIDQC